MFIQKLCAVCKRYNADGQKCNREIDSDENCVSVPSVSNMQSLKGNFVENQFIIRTGAGVYFQSYGTIVAFKRNDGKIFLDRGKWNYSKTTGKYRNIFLREDKKATEKKIKSGEYILTPLN